MAVKQYGTEAIRKIIPEKYKTKKLIEFGKSIDDNICKKPFVEKELTFTKLIDSINENSIADMLKKVNFERLAVAMKLTTESTREKIYNKIGKNKKEKLRKIFEEIGSQRGLTVLEEQRRINNIIRKVISDNELTG